MELLNAGHQLDVTTYLCCNQNPALHVTMVIPNFMGWTQSLRLPSAPIWCLGWLCYECCYYFLKKFQGMLVIMGRPCHEIAFLLPQMQIHLFHGHQRPCCYLQVPSRNCVLCDVGSFLLQFSGAFCLWWLVLIYVWVF